MYILEGQLTKTDPLENYIYKGEKLMLFARGAKAISKVKVPTSVAKLGLKCKKYTPEIMVVAGVALVVGGTIAACKQTLKAHEILEQANSDLKDIEQAKIVAADPTKEIEYTDDDARKDRMRLYIKTGARLVKCYAPAVLATVAGLGLMLGAHKVLKSRNAALAVAYSNLLTNFNQYRKRVEGEIGTEKERLLSAGAEKMDVSVENEEGDVKKVKNAMVVHDDGSMHSIYAKIFDESNSNWSRNPVTNLTFLRAQQNYANDKLRADGYLFLNDVYEMLGFPRTTEGQIVGWVFDPNNEIDDHNGDNYVDFGIYDALYKDAQAKRDFINAVEPCVWLDFNVDGVMYDLI